MVMPLCDAELGEHDVASRRQWSGRVRVSVLLGTAAFPGARERRFKSCLPSDLTALGYVSLLWAVAASAFPFAGAERNEVL